MFNAESSTYIEIPATPEIVDTFGWVLILASVIALIPAGILAAKQFKTHTVGRISDEFGKRTGRQVEEDFPY